MDELKEKLIEHGVTKLPGSAGGSIPDLSAEDLGELMGDEQIDSNSPADAPGMSIEDTGEESADLDDDTDDTDED